MKNSHLLCQASLPSQRGEKKNRHMWKKTKREKKRIVAPGSSRGGGLSVTMMSGWKGGIRLLRRQEKKFEEKGQRKVCLRGKEGVQGGCKKSSYEICGERRANYKNTWSGGKVKEVNGVRQNMTGSDRSFIGGGDKVKLRVEWPGYEAGAHRSGRLHCNNYIQRMLLL